MRKSIEVIRGNSPGTEWRLSVLTFEGRSADAPRAYLQAALHGNELPGVAALHMLIPMLRDAERDGRLRGTVTVVPHANPIGLGQHLFGEHLGRFAFGSRTNFNRNFPLLAAPDPSALIDDAASALAEVRLKALLVRLSLGHELVLDLHCDDEGLSYIYAPAPLWPAMSDLAAALGCEAAILWDKSSDGAFEEAAAAPYLSSAQDAAAGRVVSTVEFRGRADVSPDLARADAEGLYRFLVARGVLVDDRVAPLAPYTAVAAPIDHVDMVAAPVAGTILYHVRPGDRVAAGDALVTVVTAPGEDDGAVTVTAPQDGLILTRRAHRFTRPGDNLLKLVGSRRSATARPGALEA
ncbi:succinylglutamate desuccinylase/aspartoacylase domain-containing protein [Chthonobacter rhizosphaerae]|uniref:succinylglutamate desuccinylase/aspartoacylase domain-containing protein n=1 Tax=Chthonobacter rhizosphaerae TaxID=2735553 RepID=UPI0015EEF7B8|nr:succinylglutamate desuccinylase/aspartoacylase family protein [Chthonobacter rhizosphaerae]